MPRKYCSYAARSASISPVSSSISSANVSDVCAWGLPDWGGKEGGTRVETLLQSGRGAAGVVRGGQVELRPRRVLAVLRHEQPHAEREDADRPELAGRDVPPRLARNRL